MTLRIWATLLYLKQHALDPSYSRSRGVTALAMFLHTNHPAAKAVLARCVSLNWVRGEPSRGAQEGESDHAKRNPWLYSITKEGEDQLSRLDKDLRPMYFETMSRLERRVG